jgi:hypothetical protein
VVAEGVINTRFNKFALVMVKVPLLVPFTNLNLWENLIVGVNGGMWPNALPPP